MKPNFYRMISKIDNPKSELNVQNIETEFSSILYSKFARDSI